MDSLSVFKQVNQEKAEKEPYRNLMDYSPDVLEALANKKPVVALESTIISHGMEYPQNKETALGVEKVIKDNGAVPATIAIIEGRIKIGLTEELIDKLAKAGRTVKKCSRRDLANVLVNKLNGSTTVAATMILAHFAGIKVFVTGGIGGVHRGVANTMDISADLIELGSTPVAVVSAGCKSILDIPKTIEMLETLGVPVLGFKTKKFPEFFFSDGQCDVSCKVDDEKAAAELINMNFNTLKFKQGIIIGNPVPKEYEADPKLVKECIEKALKMADEQHIIGAEITPFLLKTVNELSGGNSSESNVALIKNNAAVGAKIAIELNKLEFSK